MDIKECEDFPDYLDLSKEVSNKVGFLTTSFQRLHKRAPVEDSVNLGGKIAKLWSICNKDTGRLLEFIWISSAKPCNGSHINYIYAMIKRPNGTKQERIISSGMLKKYG